MSNLGGQGCTLSTFTHWAISPGPVFFVMFRKKNNKTSLIWWTVLSSCLQSYSTCWGGGSHHENFMCVYRPRHIRSYISVPLKWPQMLCCTTPCNSTSCCMRSRGTHFTPVGFGTHPSDPSHHGLTLLCSMYAHLAPSLWTPCPYCNCMVSTLASMLPWRPLLTCPAASLCVCLGLMPGTACLAHNNAYWAPQSYLAGL